MESGYPEWGKRERMLWRVHEWCQDRTDPQQKLMYDAVATMVGDPVYEGAPTEQGSVFDAQAMQKHMGEQMNLFLNLVDEGYIHADVNRGSYKGGPPFTFATMRGLTEKGLRAIGELPKPQDELLRRLDRIEKAIQELGDSASPDERQKATRAVKELKHFVRGLPPSAAVEVLSRLLG